MLIDSSTGEWVHPDYFKVAALSNFEDVENWLRTFTLRQIYETPCPCQQPGGTGFQCNLNSEIRFRHAGRNGNVAKAPLKIDEKMGQIWDRRLGALYQMGFFPSKSGFQYSLMAGAVASLIIY